jgi:diphthine-ammonia ligase
VKLAALFSGGKDSTFAISRAQDMGHSVVCLITMHPVSDDSLLFHYPNSWVTEYLADAMQIPLIRCQVRGCLKEEEMEALEEATVQVKSFYKIQGLVHGGISSNYQKHAFEQVCAGQGIETIAPLWGCEPKSYITQLINRGFRIIITGVSSLGLGREWLGQELNEDAITKLVYLSKKIGFNLTFEGGEAETLVIDCPLYSKKIQINSATTLWDGQRGIFEIQDVALIEKK